MFFEWLRPQIMDFNFSKWVPASEPSESSENWSISKFPDRHFLQMSAIFPEYFVCQIIRLWVFYLKFDGICRYLLEFVLCPGLSWHLITSHTIRFLLILARSQNLLRLYEKYLLPYGPVIWFIASQSLVAEGVSWSIPRAGGRWNHA